MFKPFSENIIFFDAEFTSLDINQGEVISLAFVKITGEELYLELEPESEPCEWVKENVLPFLDGEKISKEEAISKIEKFAGNSSPYLVSYVNQFDMPFFYKLLPQNKSPFLWLPIDFASILFVLNIDPEIMSKNRTELYDKLNIDYKKYKKHNALEDAKLLREVYLKLSKNNEKNI